MQPFHSTICEIHLLVRLWWVSSGAVFIRLEARRPHTLTLTARPRAATSLSRQPAKLNSGLQLHCKPTPVLLNYELQMT